MEAAAWLTYPLALTGSREFECGEKTPEDCAWYMQRWHFWYVADYVYALPTVGFFMTAIAIFFIGHVVSSQLLGYRKVRGPRVWQRLIAVVRYLSYRGFHVKALRWNSAPVGVLLLGAAGAIYFFCMDLIPQPYYWPSEDFGGSPPLGTRSGWLALACMPFVFATASKTNWITLVTGVSHEKIQVFHRWSAYAFFLLALMHTFPFIVYHIKWHDMVMEVTVMSTIFYWTGIVALVVQAWLTLVSHSMIRTFNYEFFKAAHYSAVVVFIIVFFWHCDATLTSWHYFVATAAVYVPCLVYPWLRTAFEYGFAQKAYIHIEDNGFIRLTIPAVNMKWKPGQHCFLRFTSLQALSSHPFTICSLPSVRADEPSELVFYIRQGGGLTRKLYNHAQKHPGTAVSVLIDGPYGGINMQRHNDGDRLLVIAGGSGAGWVLPMIELFCRRHSNGRLEEKMKDIKDIDSEKQVVDDYAKTNWSGPTSLRVILATRDTTSRMWFLHTVGELLATYSATHPSSDLDIEIYLTGEAEKRANNSTKVVDVNVTRVSASNSSADNIEITANKEKAGVIPGKELSGRPNLPSIIHEEGVAAAESGLTLNVFVCGPDTMQNDVRNAVARENLGIIRGEKSGGVHLHSEHFSWA